MDALLYDILCLTGGQLGLTFESTGLADDSDLQPTVQYENKEITPKDSVNPEQPYQLDSRLAADKITINGIPMNDYTIDHKGNYRIRQNLL